MKLEVGMYVKFLNGNIAKLIEIEDEYPQSISKYKFDNIIGYITVSQYYYPKYISSCYASQLNEYIRQDVVPSHNIIDLIEVGDYVNGYRVSKIDFDYDEEKYVQCDYYVQCGEVKSFHYRFRSNAIYSIVTKEQFSSMEYKVKE